MEKISENIASIVDAITGDYDNGRPIDKMDMFSQPDSKAIVTLIEKLLRIVFPGYYVDRDYKIYNIKTTIAAVTEDVAYNLNKQIALALRYDDKYADADADSMANHTCTPLPVNTTVLTSGRSDSKCPSFHEFWINKRRYSQLVSMPAFLPDPYPL